MIAAIIQARTGSTRLPNKIFSDIKGQPLIWHIVRRISYSKMLERVIIATTTNQRDDMLENWARNQKLDVFRGSEEDVLSRYYEAAQFYDVDTIVRITSDDPFKDPAIIDLVVSSFLNKQVDFAYNNNPPTFPEGLDVEVFSSSALADANKDSVDPSEREHVTPFFYRNPHRFKQSNTENHQNLSYLRWTIDSQQDLDMAREVYSKLYKSDNIFLMNEILDLLRKYPYIADLNAGEKRSAMYSL
jgi:spore coat polysaccharide biosynthesis protein SpsF